MGKKFNSLDESFRGVESYFCHTITKTKYRKIISSTSQCDFC